MKLPIKAEGVALHDEKGFTSINYHSFSESDNLTNEHSLEGDLVTTHLIKDEPISDIPTAWLKLYLLSLRHFRPNQLNLENIFSVSGLSFFCYCLTMICFIVFIFDFSDLL